MAGSSAMAGWKRGWTRAAGTPNPDDSQSRAAAVAQLTGIHHHRWDALDRAETEPARLRFKSRSRSRPKQYAEGYVELLHLRHGGRQSRDGVVWAVLDPRTVKGGV